MVARGADTIGAGLGPCKEDVVGDDDNVAGGEYTRRGTIVFGSKP